MQSLTLVLEDASAFIIDPDTEEYQAEVNQAATAHGGAGIQKRSISREP